MTELILTSVVLVLLAQAIGFGFYWKKRNKYSASAQNRAIFIPAIIFVVFVILAVVATIASDWMMNISLRGFVTNWEKSTLLLGGYLAVGALANVFTSILLHLLILFIAPPKYKSDRKRRRFSAKVELSK